MFINKYKATEIKVQSWSSRSISICAAWMLGLFICTYFADDLRYEAEDSDHQYSDWAIMTSEAFQVLAKLTGVDSLKSHFAVRIQLYYDTKQRVGSTSVSTLELTSETTSVSTSPAEAQPSVLETPIELPVLKPRKVLIIGSSSMKTDLGFALSKTLSSKAKIQVIRHAKVGTGLARPDVYNWFSIARNLVRKHQPDIVIAQFIGNDCQALINTDKSIEVRRRDPDWGQTYKERTKDFVRILQQEGPEVILIGMPIMQPGLYRRHIKEANAIVKKAAQETQAHFIPIWQLSTTKNGAFRSEIRVRGITQPFRHEDGIHFSRPGAHFVAQGIYQQLQALYQWEP